MVELAQELGRLANAIEAVYCTGGATQIRSPVSIYYRTHTANEARIVSMPPDDDSLRELLRHTTVASMGVGGETVVDLQYRRAQAMTPEQFATSFNLAETEIIDEIQRLLMPDYLVRAELSKLNVYEMGGFFRPHLDTPRGAEMFGSLVVNLPCRYTGGILSLTHPPSNLRMQFDWSSTTSDALTVQWAVFYSDIAHEISPVESGARVTLTYNLFAHQRVCPPIAARNAPFSLALQQAIAVPDLLPSGGDLAFISKHLYAYDTLNSNPHLSSCLKGADAVVYAAATRLGLRVRVVPMFEKEENEDDIDETGSSDAGDDADAEDEVRVKRPKYYYKEDWEQPRSSTAALTRAEEEMQMGEMGYARWPQDRPLLLCGEWKNAVRADALARYGNEASATSMYVDAVILISLPPSASRLT